MASKGGRSNQKGRTGQGHLAWAGWSMRDGAGVGCGIGVGVGGGRGGGVL